MLKKFIYWLTAAIVITLFSLLIETSVQQNYRQSANDPQIQMSEDIATKLASGADPNSIISTEKVDIRNSLAPFVIVYNSEKSVSFSNAVLDGQVPALPDGVLKTAKNSQDRLTWQPDTSVRDAAVVTYFNGKSEGYVLVGRALKEVEIREDSLMLMVTGVWGLSMLISFVGFFLFPLKFRN